MALAICNVSGAEGRVEQQALGLGLGLTLIVLPKRLAEGRPQLDPARPGLT